MLSSPQSLIVRPVVQPLKLEGRDEEQNEAPIINEAMVRDAQVYGAG